jgi:hypothetical protein
LLGILVSFKNVYVSGNSSVTKSTKPRKKQMKKDSTQIYQVKNFRHSALGTAHLRQKRKHMVQRAEEHSYYFLHHKGWLTEYLLSFLVTIQTTEVSLLYWTVHKGIEILTCINKFISFTGTVTTWSYPYREITGNSSEGPIGTVISLWG